MARIDKLWSFCAFPSRLDCVRWHAKTNYGHFASFCHPEAIVLDDMWRQIIVIRTLLLSVRYFLLLYYFFPLFGFKRGYGITERSDFILPEIKRCYISNERWKIIFIFD